MTSRAGRPRPAGARWPGNGWSGGYAAGVAVAPATAKPVIGPTVAEALSHAALGTVSDLRATAGT